jgi:hypothetical protein
MTSELLKAAEANSLDDAANVHEAAATEIGLFCLIGLGSISFVVSVHIIAVAEALCQGLLVDHDTPSPAIIAIVSFEAPSMPHRAACCYPWNIRYFFFG